MRVAHVVKLALAAWMLRWLAAEVASRLGQRARPARAGGPLPGRMPGPFE